MSDLSPVSQYPCVRPTGTISWALAPVELTKTATFSFLSSVLSTSETSETLAGALSFSDSRRVM
jgi:hypothetical protein